MQLEHDAEVQCSVECAGGESASTQPGGPVRRAFQQCVEAGARQTRERGNDEEKLPHSVVERGSAGGDERQRECRGEGEQGVARGGAGSKRATLLQHPRHPRHPRHWQHCGQGQRGAREQQQDHALGQRHAQPVQAVAGRNFADRHVAARVQRGEVGILGLELAEPKQGLERAVERPALRPGPADQHDEPCGDRDPAERRSGPCRAPDVAPLCQPPVADQHEPEVAQ